MYINIYCTCFWGQKKNKTVDKWVVLKHVHREKRGKWNSTFSVRTVYIFKHWGRRQVKKKGCFSSHVSYLRDCCVKCPLAVTERADNICFDQNHLSTGKSRISEDFRWGVRPAASHLRLTDLNKLLVQCEVIVSVFDLTVKPHLCMHVNPAYSCVVKLCGFWPCPSLSASWPAPPELGRGVSWRLLRSVGQLLDSLMWGWSCQQGALPVWVPHVLQREWKVFILSPVQLIGCHRRLER